MNNIKIGLISCCVALGLLISGFDHSSGYFEYRYYCDVQSNIRVTISLKPNTDDSNKCLSYIKILDRNIAYYKDQIKIAQDSISQGQFVEYWESYQYEAQSKLFQSRILHKQMIKAMTTFEQELFQKTMLYVNYRLKSTRNNLEEYVQMRETSIINATAAGASEDLQSIIKKYIIEKRKLDIINMILTSTNFNELMPLYTMYQQGKFE